MHDVGSLMLMEIHCPTSNLSFISGQGLEVYFQDLTKIWCGNGENDKYIDGIRDWNVPQEVGLAKNWARDAGIAVKNAGNRHDLLVLTAKANQPGRG